MYLMGVESMGKDQVSRICAVLDEEVASFRGRTFDGMGFPCLRLDAAYVKCRRPARVESTAVITAIAVGADGLRRFVGFAVADAESYPAWREFPSDLRRRGVEGVRPVVSDAHEGLVRAVEGIYRGAGWQRCIVHLERNVAKLCTSKMLNGEADVPGALRRARLQHGLEARVVEECEILWDETLNPTHFGELAFDILGLVGEEDPRQASLARTLGRAREDSCLFTAGALIGVVGLENKSQSKALIWKRGIGSLEWAACDLFRFAFCSRRKRKNIVVIPVDCSFDTHVTRGYEGLRSKRVKENTVHGKWLTRMAQSGVLEGNLEKRLSRELKDVGKAADGTCSVGTVAVVETEKCAFFLLAISRFDRNGNVQSTPRDVANAMESLLCHYDRYGQGANLYLPLLGTGMPRAGLCSAESYRMLVETATEGSSHIAGKVTIVVLPEVALELGLTR